MPPEVILGAMILVPAAVLMLLRVNAALVFLSLCLGDVLVQFVTPDANSFLQLFSAHDSADSGNDNAKIILLLLPVILTTIIMARTVHNKLRLVLNVFPSLGVGLLGTLLVVPLLPPDLSGNIIGSQMWTEIQHFQNWIVGHTAAMCLLLLWLQRPKHAKHKSSKHK